MDEPLTGDETTLDAAPLDPIVQQASDPFVGRWNRLISTTNWEKGRIIHEWREALIEAGAAATEYSDEAWSRLVGGVTSQHVGRLRRVYRRFSDTRPQYESLYWSHFQAALDWDDAEMWLEGAVQSGWSVSEMRRTRWEAMGKLPEHQPSDEQIVTSELDEDSEPALHRAPDAHALTADSTTGRGEAAPEGPDFGEVDHPGETPGLEAVAQSRSAEAPEPVRPFEHLPELPEDVAEAFESFKLAILAHRADGWTRIRLDEMLAALDALKALALAPPDDGARA